MITDIDHLRAELKGSLLAFSRFFYKRVYGRDLIISNPPGRESHHISLCRELTNLRELRIPNHRLGISMPPGYGKSLFCCMSIAQCMALYPHSNFLYISYQVDLATEQTSLIKLIMEDAIYKDLFDVHLRRDSSSKSHFKTLQGGTVAAFGSAGPVTGRNAGLPGLDTPSGFVVIDDAIKPGEAHSDAIRAKVIRNYEETIRQRARGKNVGILYIGQRVHEGDLGGYLQGGKDVLPWHFLDLPALDENDMALYPEIHDREYLIKLRENSPYTFWSQFQQKPVPAGGALYKRDWFVELDDEPDIFASFITCDTAETEKEYNDATVFSFWGVYEIESLGVKTGQYGLHWIDCIELRIEPKLLKEHFIDFWVQSGRYKVPPQLAAIEKKSTGVTLLSVLDDVRGLQVQDVKRTGADGSKADRFIGIQRWIAEKRISINKHAKHKELVLSHMEKITANNSHRFDDICDTLVDSIQFAFIDKRFNKQQHTDTIKAARITQGNKLLVNRGNYGSL